MPIMKMIMIMIMMMFGIRFIKQLQVAHMPRLTHRKKGAVRELLRRSCAGGAVRELLGRSCFGGAVGEDVLMKSC
jgi:hypothetical protein